MRARDLLHNVAHNLGLSEEAGSIRKKRKEWAVEYESWTPADREKFDRYFEAAKRRVSEQVDIPFVVENKARYLAKAMMGKLPEKEAMFVSAGEREWLEREAAQIRPNPKTVAKPKKRGFFRK